jgi:rhodanese-related sulfurtransferase
MDVHNYATIQLMGEPVALDVTFPAADWDGRSPMEVASSPGEDLPAGHDLIAEKQQLVAAYCDSAKREPFIAALAALFGTNR